MPSERAMVLRSYTLLHPSFTQVRTYIIVCTPYHFAHVYTIWQVIHCIRLGKVFLIPMSGKGLWLAILNITSIRFRVWLKSGRVALPLNGVSRVNGPIFHFVLSSNATHTVMFYVILNQRQPPSVKYWTARAHSPTMHCIPPVIVVCVHFYQQIRQRRPSPLPRWRVQYWEELCLKSLSP